MALLPKEFSCSDERSWVLEFPSDDVSPLIELDRKVSVALNPVCIGRIHDGFTSRPDSNGFS